MVALPAICRNGHVFDGPIEIHGRVKGLTLGDIKVHGCPYCGATAVVPPGTFDVDEELVTILSGPRSTYDFYEKIGLLAKKGLNDDLPLDDVISAIEVVSPRISKILRLARSRRALYLMLLVIAFYAGTQLEGSVNLNISFDNWFSKYNYILQDKDEVVGGQRRTPRPSGSPRQRDL